MKKAPPAPKKGRTCVLYARIRTETHEQLCREADRRGVSLTWLADQLLAEALDALLPEPLRLTRLGE